MKEINNLKKIFYLTLSLVFTGFFIGCASTKFDSKNTKAELADYYAHSEEECTFAFEFFNRSAGKCTDNVIKRNTSFNRTECKCINECSFPVAESIPCHLLFICVFMKAAIFKYIINDLKTYLSFRCQISLCSFFRTIITVLTAAR